MLAYRVTLDVSADNEDVVEPWAIKFLQDRGFNVVAPNTKWESVGAFKDRLGISYMTVSRKVRPLPERPNVVIQRSRTATDKLPRIIAILSNPDFDAYCVNGKKK